MTVVVAEKEKGASKYLKTIGTSSSPIDIAGYVREAEHYIEKENKKRYPELDFEEARERISKSKLEIHPIFHFNEDGIKAHISICFVAQKVYRELDRMLKNNRMKLSVDTVLNIAKAIQTISVKMAESTLAKTLFLTKRQEQVKPHFEDNFWGSKNSSESQ